MRWPIEDGVRLQLSWQPPELKEQLRLLGLPIPVLLGLLDLSDV